MTADDIQVALLENELGVQASMSLTLAERAIMEDYIQRGSLVAVAEHRNRSIKTIESQVASVKEKLGVGSLVQAAVLYDRANHVCIHL